MTFDEALSELQADMLSPEWIFLVEETEKLLANTPAEDTDREISNIGHCYLTMLRFSAPNMPETHKLGISYAFTELLRSRSRLKGAN
jgi:hypothetical protein